MLYSFNEFIEGIWVENGSMNVKGIKTKNFEWPISSSMLLKFKVGSGEIGAANTF